MASHRFLFDEYSPPLPCLLLNDPSCPNQPPPPQPPPVSVPINLRSGTSHHLLRTFLISAFSLLFFSLLLLLFFYFLLRRRRRHQASHDAQPPPPNADDPIDDGDDDRGTHHVWLIRTVGLDDAIINSIAVTVYKSGDGLIDGGDCSVCLGEFCDGEAIKLLPKCAHAFHHPCIDTWLRSHVSCPLCRAPVVVPVVPDDSGPLEVGQQPNEEDCVIAVESEAGSSSSSGPLDENEVQPIRRSVSMDSSSLGMLLLRVESESEPEEKLGEGKKEVELQGVMVSKKGGKGGDESFGKHILDMKRSLSSRSGRLFFTRYGRGRGRGRSASVLPL